MGEREWGMGRSLIPSRAEERGGEWEWLYQDPELRRAGDRAKNFCNICVNNVKREGVGPQ